MLISLEKTNLKIFLQGLTLFWNSSKINFLKKFIFLIIFKPFVETSRC